MPPKNKTQTKRITSQIPTELQSKEIRNLVIALRRYRNKVFATAPTGSVAPIRLVLNESGEGSICQWDASTNRDNKLAFFSHSDELKTILDNGFSRIRDGSAHGFEGDDNRMDDIEFQS